MLKLSICKKCILEHHQKEFAQSDFNPELFELLLKFDPKNPKTWKPDIFTHEMSVSVNVYTRMMELAAHQNFEIDMGRIYCPCLDSLDSTSRTWNDEYIKEESNPPRECKYILEQTIDVSDE